MTYIVKSFWEDVTITAKRIKIISFCTSIIAYLIVSLIFSFKPSFYVSFLMLGFSAYIYLVRLDVLGKSKKTTITRVLTFWTYIENFYMIFRSNFQRDTMDVSSFQNSIFYFNICAILE